MPDGSIIEQSNQLFAQGRSEEGVALLTQAGESGDVDALMQLAVLDLTGGHGAPRNLRRGRDWLRRAVEIGHVDGALMEVALVANGSGQAHPDWAGALALLRIAARGDPVAAEQLALVERMSLDGQGRPAVLPRAEPLSDAPHVVRYASLLSPGECARIAAVAGPMLEPSAIVDAGGQLRPHPVRTAMAAVIGPANEDLVIRAINHRLAAITGTATEQGEPLSVMRYDIAQQYRMHIDALSGTNNQRIKTAIIYLNHGYEGGETLFESGPRIAGRQGDAIVFDNVKSDGSPDPVSRHAGLPVVRGVKWIATRWIREASYDPWTYRPGN
jgi:prolyl 4-hydroxylase